MAPRIRAPIPLQIEVDGLCAELTSGTLSEFGGDRSITQGFAAKGREILGFDGETPSA
jgi:hypothetical protein